ncbi:MAG: DUF924 family protein [Desulfopila sp.]|jgi:uncharacterized protein (DUF924 family)|nr:DUF924 family protein [Desulfopila sp.]
MIETVLKFWFDDTSPAQWWKKDEDFDEVIRQRFTAVHRQAVRCELFYWRSTAHGRLAEILILDQFSRNMFRNSPQAFANDPLALALAQEAVACGADRQMSAVKRSFFYLPFMHSESRIIHEEAEKLYSQPGLESNLEWEIKHRKIIERFNRYPHRNDILGRQSTAEEREFLKQPGSSF